MIASAGPGSTSTIGPGYALLTMAGCALLGLPGWLAYTGRVRRWTAGPFGRALPYFPFGLAWMGAGGFGVSLAGLIAALGRIAADVAYLILGVPGFAMFFCGLVFAFWTPRRLRPAWYRQHAGSRS